jgi:hypothetical protein
MQGTTCQFLYWRQQIVKEGGYLNLWSLRPTVKVPFCCCMLFDIQKSIDLLLICPIWVVLRWRCVWSDGEMTLRGETHMLGEKPVVVLLCPLQISHGLALYLIYSCVVRGWQLTAWAMAWPWRQNIQIKHHREHMIPLVNPLPVQFKSLLHGQEGCIFFQWTFKFTYV